MMRAGLETIAVLDPQRVPLAGVHLIEASAGTGKTYTITSLYLRLLLERGLLPEQILVVTFTEAATKELADRIRGRLRQCLAAFDGAATNDPFLLWLADRHQGDARARAVLVNAIRSMDLAAIYTIHGFCRRILEECAFESGALFETEFLYDDSDILQQVVDDYWRTRSPAWSPLMVGYLHSKGANSDSLLAELEEPVRVAQSHGPESLLLPAGADPAAVDDAVLGDLVALWRAERQTVLALVTDGSLSQARDNYCAANVEAWAAALDRFAADPATPVPVAALQRFSAQALASSPKSKKKPVVPQHPFFDRAQQLIEMLEAARQGLRRELIDYALKELSARKRQQGVLTFDDLLTSVRDGLAGPNGAVLAERLRRRFPAGLIDEFQDTDPVQFAIFARIYEASARASLFLIGDPKQAIYSFRGADIFTYLAAAARADSRYTLETNWRSEPELLTALNHLFSLHGDRRPPFVFPEIRYHPVRAAERQHDRLLLDDGGAALTVWQFEASGSRDETKERIAAAVAGEIGRLLAAGRAGEALIGEEPLAAADIAVLVRSHRDGEQVRSALEQAGIRSVIYSQDSVFVSKDAWELALVLAAVHDPWDERRLKTALATSLLGHDAAGLCRLEEDERLWERTMDRFVEYQRLWREQGFATMLRELLRQQEVKERLARGVDGERRLTNLRHLMELLQAAVHDEGLGPAELLMWHRERRRRAGRMGDEEQLRLESDRHLVKIVTIHKAKGLEYPVVFCPFLWENSPAIRGRTRAAVGFHDRDGGLRLDLGTGEIEEHRQRQQTEALAEDLRLLYVALTRARHRCYCCWGRVGSARQEVAATSPLGYLLHPPAEEGGKDLIRALNDSFRELDDEAVQAPLRRLAIEAGGTVAVRPLPLLEAAAGAAAAERPELAAPLAFSRRLAADWAIRSFSGLLRGGDHGEGRDRDEFAAAAAAPAHETEEQTIFSFPRGARAGTCLHAILEELDFCEPDREPIRSLVAENLQRYGFAPEWTGPLVDALGRMVATPLDPEDPELRLDRIERAHRLNEMEFHYPLGPVSPQGLSRVFAAHRQALKLADLPERLGSLVFSPGRGFMKGFVDLVFEWRGRFFIADYKSNHLGDSLDCYTEEQLGRAVAEAHYALQYHIYTVALHRYLALRLGPAYDYDTHLGGAYYLFLRGMDPAAGPGAGVFRERPARALIEDLDRYLAGDRGEGR